MEPEAGACSPTSGIGPMNVYCSAHYCNRHAFPFYLPDPPCRLLPFLPSLPSLAVQLTNTGTEPLYALILSKNLGGTEILAGWPELPTGGAEVEGGRAAGVREAGRRLRAAGPRVKMRWRTVKRLAVTVSHIVLPFGSRTPLHSHDIIDMRRLPLTPWTRVRRRGLRA